MKKLFMIILLWLAFLPAAEAQYICHITLQPNVQDTQFRSTGLSCYGNSCTATMIGETGFHGPINPHDKLFFKRSDDGGRTWKNQDPDLGDNAAVGDHLVKIVAIDSANVVAIGDTSLVLRTFDAGNTWHRQTLPVQLRYLTDVSFANPNEGILINSEYTFTTVDGGVTWTQVKIPFLYLCACHAYGSGKFRGMSYGYGKIYTTNDNWKSIDSTDDALPEGIERNSHVLARCNFGQGDTLFAFGNKQLPGNPITRIYPYIIRSTNAGVSWTLAYEDTTLLRGDALSMSSVERDTIVLATALENSNVLRSTDRGRTWRYDSLLFTNAFNAATVYGVDLTAKGDLIGTAGLTSTVLFYAEPSPPSKVETYSHIPYYSYLYPNPVSESLYIVSQDRSQPIFVYDMLGREVERGMLDANGKCTLNVSKLAPSIYVVMLQHDGQLLPVSRVAISR